ncbi:hypothetical protein ACN469_21515 [Corallococcus terminator]
MVESAEPVAVDFSSYLRVSDSASTPQVSYSIPNGSGGRCDSTSPALTAWLRFPVIPTVLRRRVTPVSPHG